MSKLPLIVTGAAGMIGSRFVESCLIKNQPVISVDDLQYFKERPEHAALDFGTLIDKDDFFDWFKKEQPQVRGIIHLGACTDTTEMNIDYLNEVNLKYSQKIWNLCSEKQLPLLYASSAATYGDGAHGYEDLEHQLSLLKPLNPYGVSKHEFDLWALEQEKKGNHPKDWSGYKFFNVYGFGERHKGKMASVVLKAFDQILDTGKVKLFKSDQPGMKDGEQKRDFISVEDVVSILWFGLEKPIRRGIFNLGTGHARTFLDLVHSTYEAMGISPQIEFIDMPEELKGRYQSFTEAHMDRLRNEGYNTPFLSLEEGIQRYIKRLKEL
ncbi:MAG: ADP-glyceromanno-heptose 6-epimerase [Bdellovibrionaceae bacterium]|nr:ADP-glyceromanno-heptose 6-epimerase [Pseudobdellovibrionaceae bacterium]